MDFNSIDWQKIWKDQKKKHTKSNKGSIYWNKRAPSFAANNNKSYYANALIKMIRPERAWTALDMGCGAGTLALPLADKVKHITAVDFSETMLDMLNSEIKKRKIKNIKSVHASWEDDWRKAGIGKYDIAIASRSAAVDNLKEAIMKLDYAAKKQVILTTAVADGPRDRKLFDAIGRKFPAPVDYIFVYNLIYQLGITASIEFIVDEYDVIFKDHESAVNSFKWMFDGITPGEEKKLTDYIAAHLKPHKGKMMLDYKRIVKWAVIRWDKEV